MSSAAGLLGILLCLPARAQSVPAKPSVLDAKLKAAYVSFITAKAASNPAAKEISRFYAAHPELDMRFPDAQEFTAYAGPQTPPLELIRAYFDPRLEVIVVPRTEELEGMTAETMPGGAALAALLSIRANDILHESFHARLDKALGFKIVNIMEDELLANWKEALYLAKERPSSPELARAADDELKIDELKSAGVPPDKRAAIERKEQGYAEAFGADQLDAAVKVARLEHGASYFKRSINALYAGAGLGRPSVFSPRPTVEAALRRELSRPDLSENAKEALLVQLSFWSRPERVEKARAYFRAAITNLCP